MSSGMADDLPRTLRRAREARERGLDGGGDRSTGRGAQSAFVAQPVGPDATFSSDLSRSESVVLHGNTVTDIRIPFFRMMVFCFKLVFAAVPALIMLGVLLWLAGHALMTYAPWLVKLQILIRVPTT